MLSGACFLRIDIANESGKSVILPRILALFQVLQFRQKSARPVVQQEPCSDLDGYLPRGTDDLVPIGIVERGLVWKSIGAL